MFQFKLQPIMNWLKLTFAITFLAGKYLKCQLSFAHKVMIGTVDRSTTIQHNLH